MQSNVCATRGGTGILPVRTAKMAVPRSSCWSAALIRS